MATRQQMLDDVNLRYRNTFSTDQKLVWVNDYEQELFDIFDISAPPYNFTTVEGEEYYPIPDEVDTERIQTITIERSNGTYEELQYRHGDEVVNPMEFWYTIVSNLFYIHVPGGTEDNRNVYIYHEVKPTPWETSNLSQFPDTPLKYQEVLKLHLLEMIAGARKDVTMKNNFMMDKEKKIEDFLWNMKMSEPEFPSVKDVQPKAGRRDYYVVR